MKYSDDTQTHKSNLDYIRSAMNEPMLEKEYELDLARRWKENQDEAALHELIRSYTRLVVAAASKFKNYGLPMGDLIQEGNIGLMQAAERFEHERELRFSTYASWWIRSAIQDYILRNWSIVRTGTTSSQKSLFFNLRRLRARIERESGFAGLDDDGRETIANDLGVKVKDVEDMEARMNGGDSSLNAIVSEDGAEEFQNFLADDRPNPEEVVIAYKDAKTRSAWLNEALGKLTYREQKIIRERHLQYETVTLEELGKELGISKERVRQLEARAMEKLRDTLEPGMDNPKNMFLEA